MFCSLLSSPKVLPLVFSQLGESDSKENILIFHNTKNAKTRKPCLHNEGVPKILRNVKKSGVHWQWLYSSDVANVLF